MRCPFCEHKDTQVIDSRASEEGTVIRRRRQCLACKRRFTTFEQASLDMPDILKKDGERVPYNHDKVLASMSLALRKRPITQQRILEALDGIERILKYTGESVVRSERVGELVLQALRQLDAVAYIRFASVYLNVSDPNVFTDMVANLHETQEAPFDIEAFKEAVHRDNEDDAHRRRLARTRAIRRAKALAAAVAKGDPDQPIILPEEEEDDLVGDERGL